MRLIAVLVLVLALAACGTRLQRESDDNVRKMALDATPVGSSIADVRRAAAGLDQNCLGNGVTEDALNPGSPSQLPFQARSYISACVGSGWQLVFRAYTFVFWYFDANGLLVDVEVRREIDSF